MAGLGVTAVWRDPWVQFCFLSRGEVDGEKAQGWMGGTPFRQGGPLGLSPCPQPPAAHAGLELLLCSNNQRDV